MICMGQVVANRRLIVQLFIFPENVLFSLLLTHSRAILSACPQRKLLKALRQGKRLFSIHLGTSIPPSVSSLIDCFDEKAFLAGKREEEQQ